MRHNRPAIQIYLQIHFDEFPLTFFIISDSLWTGFNFKTIWIWSGILVKGEEFDSSYARSKPATFDLNGEEVIGGWREALQLMKEGAKWELVLLPNLAYGAKGSGDIGPNETLIYEIKLISVK